MSDDQFLLCGVFATGSIHFRYSWSQVYSHMGFSSMNHLTCCAATANVLENKKCYENISPGTFIFLGFRLVAWTRLLVIKVMLHKLKLDQISCLMTVSNFWIAD